MKINEIYLGDCLEVMKQLEDNSISAIVTDPPYGLSFMGKHWDYDVPSIEIWQECLRVLKPGGYLLSFAGTRTQHRMAVRIEDAGFEIRDMIAWVYGSGFPKSLNIGKAVDKLQGNEREELGKKVYGDGHIQNSVKSMGYQGNEDGADTRIETKGTSEWEGWGTALKPALEPITVARKPLSEKSVAQNCLKWGVGGIAIDECRIKPDYQLQGNDLLDIIRVCQLNHLLLSVNSAEKKRFQDDMTNAISKLYSALESADTLILEKTLGKLQEDTTTMDTLCCEEMSVENMNTSLNTFTSGKKSSDLYLKIARYTILTAQKMITDWKISNLLIGQLTEGLLTQVKRLETTSEGQGRFPSNLIHDGSDEVVGLFPQSKGASSQKFSPHSIYGGNSFNKSKTILETDYYPGFNDSGSAARFFYCAKASKSERNRGCEGLEEKAYAISNQAKAEFKRGNEFEGHEQGDWNAIKTNKNNHPTVKPIALMEYLVRLVSQEGAVVLDPFAGSGSTLIACKNLGRNFIGIEKEADYIEIAKARLSVHETQ